MKCCGNTVAGQGRSSPLRLRARYRAGIAAVLGLTFAVMFASGEGAARGKRPVRSRPSASVTARPASPTAFSTVSASSTSVITNRRQFLADSAAPQRFGMQISYDPTEADIDALARMGIRWVRTVMSRDRVMFQGERDFSRYDAIVQAAAARDMGIVFVLYDDGNNPPDTPAERAAYLEVAAPAASRYREHRIVWEIWNEPNSARFWAPSPNPTNYALLAAITALAIHAQCDQPVVAMSTSRVDMGFISDAFNSFPELNFLLDGVSVHPYGVSAPEFNLGDYDQLRRFLDARAFGERPLPIYCTEWGYPTSGGAFVTENVQASYLSRILLVNHLVNSPVSILYSYRDDGTAKQNSERSFGVVRLDSRRKAAYAAVQALSEELEGYKYTDRITAGSQDFLLRFRRPDNGAAKLAAWTIGPKRTVTLPAPVRVERFRSLVPAAPQSPKAPASPPRTGSSVANRKINLTGVPQILELR